MLLIEASGQDVVYRSRNCLQVITSTFKNKICDSCTGLIENIKKRGELSPEEKRLDFNSEDKHDEILKTIEVNNKGYFQEPLVVKFSKLNDLDEKLRDIPDENNTENVINAPHGQLQITLKKTKRVLTKKIGQIKCPFCDEFVLDKSRKKMVVQHVKLIHFSEAETEAYQKFISEDAPEKLKSKFNKVARTIIKCPFCEELFKKGSTKSVRHVKLVHHSEEESQRYKNFFLENPPQECKLCGRSFKSFQSFHDHSRKCLHGKKEKTSCHLCGKVVAGIEAHIELHKVEQTSSCHICGISFNNQRKLYNHLLRCQRKSRNEETKWINCKLCGKNLTEGGLSVHIQRVHHKTYKKKECEQCGKNFYNGKSLREHVIAIHDKIKPFLCDLCGFKTAKLGNLNLHRHKSHGGPPSYFKQSNLWELIQSGKHPYIDNNYEYLHLLKPMNLIVNPDNDL